MNVAQQTAQLAEARLDRKPPKNSEDELALRFTARHGDNLRYVAAWGRWMIYASGRWQPDETMRAFDYARAICRKAAATCNDPMAKKIASAKTRAAVESLARSDPTHAARVDIWDANPFLLNTPGDTVDLSSGDTNPHRREDYLTKMTAVSPGGQCPTWHAFLDRVTAGDLELQNFLQRVAGYALTAETREHALFFLYGTGANGKSVFLNTLSGLAGDYHRTAPMEVFTTSNSDRHPTELAMLRGARLVTAIETEEGRHWNEAKIKALTGGDSIAARFMRQDFFEFVPVFKLLIAGNHKPHLRSVDEAIRRRLHLIPFTVTIPEGDRDETLPDKLKREWPGILDWAIDGALDWHEQGLSPPETVRAATADYLTAEDALATWIADRCEEGPQFKTSASNLYASFKDWCEANGERAGSQRAFSQRLEAHGYQKEKTRTGRLYAGLKVKLNYEREDGL